MRLSGTARVTPLVFRFSNNPPAGLFYKLVGREVAFYLLARKLPPLDPNVSVAVIEQRKYKDHPYFFEHTVRNSGRVYLRCFIDRDEAMIWLNEQG